MKRFNFYLVIVLISPNIVKLEVPQYLQSRYGNNVNGPHPSPGTSSYSGVKTKTKTAPAQPPSLPGMKFRGGCISAPPTPRNAGLRCSQYSGCRAECMPQYQFPNGATQLFITCENGQWIIERGIWQFLPSCEPICLPPCQNRGICTSPNECQCPENYSGEFCEEENKPCMNYPVLPANSRRTCTSKACTISCLNGHQFPDGSAITTMSCKDGFWVPDREKWKSLPDCEPTCDPPCLNGGNCLSLNVCQCPQMFRGPQCQYSILNCDVRNLKFNGGYKCSGDKDSLTCSLSCPDGMKFNIQPSPAYTCAYAEAVFKPAPIPECIFLEPVPSYNPNFYSSYHNNSNFNLNSLSVNGFPEGSYIPAGHRWDMEQSYSSRPESLHEAENIQIVTLNPFDQNNNVQFVQQKLPEPGVCFTWQGSHYKTFDGRVFSFESKCAHTLVSDAVDNTFSVVVQNDPRCYNDPSGCYREITIYFDTKKFILKRSDEGIPIFTTPKKRLPIPGQLPGVRVEMSAHYIILSLDAVGATIKWDGQQLVQVEVQESLWNRTQGLCGNIDGNASNDFLDSSGHKPQTIAGLATSWKVQNLEAECIDQPREDHACANYGPIGFKSQQATTFCEKLLNDRRFAPCHLVIDVSVLLDACRWDYCSCKNPDPSVCACETMNMYVRSCTYKGITNLAAWRDDTTCPMKCTGGRVYKACGPSDGQPVCGASTELVDNEQNGCVEGCYCPEGTVLHQDRCITPDRCPCKLRTKSFPPGAQVPKECNTCTCKRGQWICTQLSCGSRCAAIGDPHYVTFDGRRFDFMGQCSYYLVKTPKFSIEAENVACAGAISEAMNLPSTVASGLPSCTKTVTIKISGQTIKLKQNHDVVVNGIDITKVPHTVADVTIRSVSSIFLQVELPNGIKVWWDGVTRAYIDIPANFAEKTAGLCGSFNSNQKDDFITPEGDIEQAVIPFANKWKTSEKCNDIPDVLKSHPCSSNMQNEPTAEKHCKQIKSSLFEACHWIVDPEPYYQDCLYDMCSCEFKVSKCLCPTVAAYAEECSRQGVKISWRETIRECGVHCQRGQKYQICGSSCTRTCFDVASRPDCKPQCVEGCNCPEGEALNDDGECVPIGECKCHHDGLEFHPGYKEVRPASKGPELCTCINAFWSCRPATPEEGTKFPQASDLKSLCAATENMEFTTCEPVEPITCKNMHSPDYFSASVCHAGCKCKDDYVLDTSTKKCVKPSECPCHHGGKSYKENETVHSDCNTCNCQNGKWMCTERLCSAECSAWGDSHFKTFDGKHYDFQGQCDYVLAKGVLGGDSFDISIQNVPCGSLGTSCSKSVTIRVKSGGDQDLITLTHGKALPDDKSFKHIIPRQKGIFNIIEAPDLGLVVQWDKGTRVYVKVDPRWKDKTRGLCGNYNDNDADDFQTPSGGITEVSAIIFGDSWKLQAYCPETSEVTNTCENRPDRKVWALKKCGVLKSPLFSPCHSEVPVDVYLEKCVFDACACDQGGDCECLCTAVAAYAQECNTRGVPIKWRSQELCPMQCDERCARYSPCISTCPTETCDNLLTDGQLSKTCNEDTCIEGCAPNPCPPDHIYLNSSFFECVPRNICKPICIEIDGVTYFEGDLVEGDDCYSCHCSRGHKVCKGQPCSTQSFTTIRPTTYQLEQLVKCQSGWTEWINQDKAKPSKTGKRKKPSDIEPLPTALILNNLIGGRCTKEKMVNIECRTVNTHRTPKETELNVECSLERGLVCESTSKGKACEDFEIRVFCECEETPTTTPASCDPLKPHKEHPTNCSMFYHCEDSPEGPKYIEKTCEGSLYFDPVAMVCNWPYQVEEMKPECKQVLSTTSTIEPEVAHSLSPVESEIPSKCPFGTRENDCAIQCDRLCLYYHEAVITKGLCKNNKKCESGCVKTGINPNCPDGMFRANNETCVALEDCMCRSNDGKPIKPGAVYRESDCRVCQCIDNYYACREDGCVKPEDEAEAKDRTTTKKPIGLTGGIENILATTIPSVLSTVTPPEKCDEDRYIDLMQGDQPLPNVVLNASSVLSATFEPQYAKFDSKVTGESGGSWSPKYTDTLQYLEIDLGQQEPIYGIKIKGSPLYDEYVTSYKVSFSPDGSGTFLPVLNKDRLPQAFRGSIDADTPVEQMFQPPFEAQIIRIHPETWHVGIALKVELIGCGLPFTTPEFIEVSTTPSSLMCDEPMGLDDGAMYDQQISVSSELDRDHTKSDIKLSGDSAWQPVTNSPTEFVQFDFTDRRNISGVETKGGPKGWVTAFAVRYSQDNKVWNPIINRKTNAEQVFLGNFDADTPQLNHFELPINAQYLKIFPKKWQHNIQMRVEVLGCFEPYPTILEELSTVVPSACDYCPGVVAESLELQACRCAKDQWWDGENCVARTECPCFVGHISYPVGTSYKKEDCSECLCKIGGVSHCTQKQCDSCEKGLRSIVTSTCKCICQPCPDGTTLCPTSNGCINSTLWCNGIQDCPDDEENCVTTTVRTTQATTVPTTSVTEKVAAKCPKLQCPLGYSVRIVKPSKGRRYQTSMFSMNGRDRRKESYTTPGVKSGVKSLRRTFLHKPITNGTRPGEKREQCTEFTCEIGKEPPEIPGSIKDCPPGSCPEGYKAVFLKQDYMNNKCPQYTCNPNPPLDAVCNVTGRTFNTFDDAEYKYDICNHILARDLEDGEWEISLKKNCEKTCWRDLVIQPKDHILIIHPNLTSEYDGFSYSLQQTLKIGSRMSAFSIYQLGNTLLFVSRRYGFWIIWDQEGNVKLGVSRKLIDKIDGLCGYFNENPNDDKRKPDGTVARTTVDFGDSWAQAHEPQLCEPQACPLHIQNKAWEICQAKEKVLEPCTRIINKDAFISHCIETTCDCLQAAANNRTSEEECRCHSLEKFVVECLSLEPNTEVSDWRLQLNCPVTCAAPLVYHDCYQRKCEPTCETLSNPDEACPKISNVCFPGCYCPPGTVKKDGNCISPPNCKDCECNVLPHLQYVTYDNSNFTIHANCVYVMSRDIPEEGNDHKFQVFITNAPCKNNQAKTCVGKVTILYEGRKIHIFTDMIRRKLKMIVDGARIDDYSELTWAKVREKINKHLKIQLIDVQVEVSVYYPSLGVSVEAPSQKYGGKLEGLCGDCDANPYNDFRTPSGAIINDTNAFALSWLYDKLPGGQSKADCQIKPDTCPLLPKEEDPCNLILDYQTFGQCLRLLDPSIFLDWCQKDTCGNHPELACDAIEAYAKDCASAGLCINWRTNICPPKECPSDQIYNPCGTLCPKTCQSIKEKEKACSNIPAEGCFCPEGLVLRNDTCVLEKDCEVCDEEGHHPGDTWKKDKCTTCTCEGTSLKCDTQHCSGSDKICEQGYQVVKIPTSEDECCDKYACVPEPTSGPTCETPQPITCSNGQIMKLAKKNNGCQQFICECKPKDECEPVQLETSLDEGYNQTIDDSGCCPQVKIVCQKELCSKPKPCQQYHTLKNETGTNKCCPLFTCEPPKDKCIYENEYMADESGGERPRTEMEKQKVLKNANETWDDGPCRHCKCVITSIGNYQASCGQTDCSAIEMSQDYLDYELIPEMVFGQCCPDIKRVACRYNQKVYKIGDKWTNPNDHCTVYECVNTESGVQKETKVTTCETNCDLGFEYIAAVPKSKQCCGSCKPYACVVDGLIHKVGDEWTSPDHCVKYSCLNINGSMQVQSIKVSCPNLTKDFTDNFLVETKPIEGECCKEHKATACKVNGEIYQVGETWPSPDGDKCKTITCVKNQKEEISKQEIVETCKTNCSKGSEYKKSDVSCCGECVRFACVVDEKLKKPGENWTSPDNCTTYTCEHFGDEFIVSSQQESCPSLEDCPEENIYVKGCCKHCNITSEANKQCTVEAIALNKTIGLLRADRGEHGSCVNKEPVQSFTECIGSCRSSTFFNLKKGSHESDCSCCQATRYESLEVDLVCEDGFSFKKVVAVPSECGCEGCAAPAKSTKSRKSSNVKT